MAKEREKELFFIGPLHPVTGEPAEWVAGVNAADLDGAYIEQMTDDQYKAALDSGLYAKAKPSAAKTEPPSAKGKEG